MFGRGYRSMKGAITTHQCLDTIRKTGSLGRTTGQMVPDNHAIFNEWTTRDPACPESLTDTYTGTGSS